MGSRNKIQPFGVRGSSAQVSRQFEMLRRRFVEASAKRDYAAAALAAEAVLKIQPDNVAVLADYAFSLMRQGCHAQAHQIYLRVYKATAGQVQAGQTWLDGLTEVCGWLDRPEDVRRYGKESLDQADARLGQGEAASAVTTISSAPPAFEAHRPERNIISYTLFGANPRYCETAVKNVEVAADLFPQWRCRVYLDDTVPAAIHQRLRDAGAQVIDMSREARAAVHPLMWRFLVADDPAVTRFLIRDADSLLSEREQMAVQAWTESRFWFHHLRDYFTHTELILAGLWGGCRGALPALTPLMKNWLARQRGLTRFADQIFLREEVWPLLRQSVLNHDEIFGFHDARPFPAHAPIRWKTDRFHVGSNASFKGIQGSSAKADGELQAWAVLDEQGAMVCTYSSPVRGQRWNAELPFFMIDRIASGGWKVTVAP